MGDVDESSSESNIEEDGIMDLSNTPHEYNKKGYDLKMTKNSDNNYVSRLGFNLYKLPGGDYTICVEFFSSKMINLSVYAYSSKLNVGQQITTTFTKWYIRSVIHVNKSNVSPPEYLMLDLRCEGETSFS